MECQKCRFLNPEGAKFCIECGDPMEFHCPKCGAITPGAGKFCLACGHKLDEEVDIGRESTKPKGERKHITVFFSDMSGYTAMSEHLDPEDVKEISSHIFARISEVIDKYEGFVEKFVGDAVMALFGVPKAHEDDPVRAIRAAREIHDLVKALSPELEEKVGRPLSMHTGINTGLVVTGELNMVKGTHGVAGDTVNLAARLSNLGKEGDILVGPDTHAQAEGYFDFEKMEPKKRWWRRK